MPVSVILPNYNHARWLPRALTALARQNPAPAEIIIVDDASTDDSVSIIKSFQKSYSFVRLIRHEVNQGAELAVQTALKQATGEFLLFAAADDFVLPDLFARAIPALRNNSEAAFFCSEVLLIGEDDQIIGFRPITIPRSTPGYVSPSEMRRAIRGSDNWFVGTSIVYRHAHLAGIGYFDHSLGTLQDAMATRLLAFRHGFFFESDVLATWRIIKESLSMRSSLSSAENKKLLDLSKHWIASHFPADIRDEYGVLFDRRLRFNMARQRLAWRQGSLDTVGIAEVLNCSTLERTCLSLVAKLPWSSLMILAWMTIRTRPYGIGPILLSWWRNLAFNHKRAKTWQRTIGSTSEPHLIAIRPPHL